MGNGKPPKASPRSKYGGGGGGSSGGGGSGRSGEYGTPNYNPGQGAVNVIRNERGEVIERTPGGISQTPIAETPPTKSAVEQEQDRLKEKYGYTAPDKEQQARNIAEQLRKKEEEKNPQAYYDSYTKKTVETPVNKYLQQARGTPFESALGIAQAMGMNVEDYAAQSQNKQKYYSPPGLELVKGTNQAGFTSKGYRAGQEALKRPEVQSALGFGEFFGINTDLAESKISSYAAKTQRKDEMKGRILDRGGSYAAKQPVKYLVKDYIEENTQFGSAYGIAESLGMSDQVDAIAKPYVVKALRKEQATAIKEEREVIGSGGAALTTRGVLPKGTQKQVAMDQLRVKDISNGKWNLTEYGGGMGGELRGEWQDVVEDVKGDIVTGERVAGVMEFTTKPNVIVKKYNPAVDIGLKTLFETRARRQEEQRTGKPFVENHISVPRNMPYEDLMKIPSGVVIEPPSGTEYVPGSFNYNEKTGKYTYKYQKEKNFKDYVNEQTGISYDPNAKVSEGGNFKEYAESSKGMSFWNIIPQQPATSSIDEYAYAIPTKDGFEYTYVTQTTTKQPSNKGYYAMGAAALFGGFATSPIESLGETINVGVVNSPNAANYYETNIMGGAGKVGKYVGLRETAKIGTAGTLVTAVGLAAGIVAQSVYEYGYEKYSTAGYNLFETLPQTTENPTLKRGYETIKEPGTATFVELGPPGMGAATHYARKGAWNLALAGYSIAEGKNWTPKQITNITDKYFGQSAMQPGGGIQTSSKALGGSIVNFIVASEVMGAGMGAVQTYQTKVLKTPVEPMVYNPEVKGETSAKFFEGKRGFMAYETPAGVNVEPVPTVKYKAGQNIVGGDTFEIYSVGKAKAAPSQFGYVNQEISIGKESGLVGKKTFQIGRSGEVTVKDSGKTLGQILDTKVKTEIKPIGDNPSNIRFEKTTTTSVSTESDMLYRSKGLPNVLERTSGGYTIPIKANAGESIGGKTIFESTQQGPMMRNLKVSSASGGSLPVQSMRLYNAAEYPSWEKPFILKEKNLNFSVTPSEARARNMRETIRERDVGTTRHGVSKMIKRVGEGEIGTFGSDRVDAFIDTSIKQNVYDKIAADDQSFTFRKGQKLKTKPFSYEQGGLKTELKQDTGAIYKTSADVVAKSSAKAVNELSGKGKSYTSSDVTPRSIYQMMPEYAVGIGVESSSAVGFGLPSLKSNRADSMQQTKVAQVAPMIMRPFASSAKASKSFVGASRVFVSQQPIKTYRVGEKTGFVSGGITTVGLTGSLLKTSSSSKLMQESGVLTKTTMLVNDKTTSWGGGSGGGIIYRDYTGRRPPIERVPDIWGGSNNMPFGGEDLSTGRRKRFGRRWTKAYVAGPTEIMMSEFGFISRKKTKRRKKR